MSKALPKDPGAAVGQEEGARRGLGHHGGSL